jgi:uncharacterized phage protein (TIGR01671 family)
MVSWEELLEQYDAIDIFQRDLMTLMQYTGLHDKNGREIYEGDILDIGLRDQDGKPVVAPVSYEAYLAGYALDNEGHGIWQRLDVDGEVIGNIFENPELLGASK